MKSRSAKVAFIVVAVVLTTLNAGAKCNLGFGSHCAVFCFGN